MPGVPHQRGAWRCFLGWAIFSPTCGTGGLKSVLNTRLGYGAPSCVFSYLYGNKNE